MSTLRLCEASLWHLRFVMLFALLLDSRIHCCAQYSPEEWPQFTLQFSQEGTLKEIFDAGLRPYRFPTLEKLSLEAKHARVTVLQRNGEPLPEFPAERIAIDPLQGGLLESIELTRYKTTLEESRALMDPFLAKGGRTPQQLEQFLAAVKADHLDYDGMGRGVENFFVRWSEDGGPRYVVTFRKAFDSVRPLILIMSIDWSQVRTPRQKNSFYKEPIPPPPGYENVSMQAPKRFGPDSQADILVSQGKPISGDRPDPGIPAPFATLGAPPPVSSILPPHSTRSFIWLWLLAAAAFSLIALLVRKLCQKM